MSFTAFVSLSLLRFQKAGCAVQRLKSLMITVMTNTSSWSSHQTVCVSPGQGIFCHLSALRDLATSKGQTPPGLFADAAFLNYSGRIILSSSTLTCSSLQVAMFAPEDPDGFSLTYSFHGERIRICAGSYPRRNNPEFLQAVNTSLKDIFAVLRRGGGFLIN